MNALEEYRQREGLTKVQLAGLLGLSKSVVGRYVTGERQIGPRSLPRISEITGIPARELRPDLADLIGVG